MTGKMARHIPSMTSLRAFEATARHLSFTRAADELNLTQTAISHQVSKLESLLGAKLFIRRNNQVHLSEIGRDYLDSVRSEIIEIANATARVKERSAGRTLSIASLTAFCIKCLTPRLRNFQALHPDILISVETEVSFSRFKQIDYDISIQYGNDDDWPGLITYKLNRDELFPVCSPDLLRSLHLTKPEDLSRHTLIATSSLIVQNDWPMWLNAANVPDLAFSSRITFAHLLPALEAAINGLGVTMARELMVRSELVEGRLIEPFSIRLQSRSGYRLVIKPDRINVPQVRLFKDWLLTEFDA